MLRTSQEAASIRRAERAVVQPDGVVAWTTLLSRKSWTRWAGAAVIWPDRDDRVRPAHKPDGGGLRPRGDIGVIHFNRPQALNAVNTALSAAVGEALEPAAADDVRVVVVTGRGRAFCAGVDLKELRRALGACPEHEEWGFVGLARHRIDTPLIAAVKRRWEAEPRSRSSARWLKYQCRFEN